MERPVVDYKTIHTMDDTVALDEAIREHIQKGCNPMGNPA